MPAGSGKVVGLWCVCILGLTPDILPAGSRGPFHGVPPNAMLCVGQRGCSEGTGDIFSGGQKQEAISAILSEGWEKLRLDSANRKWINEENRGQ